LGKSSALANWQSGFVLLAIQAHQDLLWFT